MSDTGTSAGSPYRGGAGSAPTAEARENGIVDDLIQQFADPLAFYRELVQNSIDADATRIAITLGWDPEPEGAGQDDPLGLARIRVSDDGCGMSRDVLENQLTVLFRSGKEGQADKIGKFGVGFVSVLALEPERVIVRTSEGRGEVWTLVLQADQTYELFQAQAGGQAGTSVSLEVSVRRSELDALATGSRRALTTWCRHAELPIRFVATLPGQPMREVRIDRPLGIDALAQVKISRGSTTVVAGVIDGGGPYLGFFNRGLLLHETTKDLFGQVHVKIQDANLEHTLSRDNVRRDAHYEHAMQLAREAVDRQLTSALQERIEAVAAGRHEGSPLDALLLAALRAGLAVDYDRVAVPLVEPINGARSQRLDRLARGASYASAGGSAMTEALARRSIAVIDLSVASDPGTYLAVLERLLRRRPAAPDSALTLATPVEPTGADGALLDRTADILAACSRRPSGIRLGVLSGLKSDALWVPGEVGSTPVALSEDETNGDVFRLLLRPPIILNVDRPLVREARRVAMDRLGFAAAMLARGLLVAARRLDDNADDAWLESAITGLAR